jgi:hypothetical protein
MGKVIKMVFASAMIILVVAYAAIGFSLNKSMDAKIARLEDLATNATRKKEYLIEQSLSLEAMKKNLGTELALEKEKAKQRQLAAELTALNEKQRLDYLQQLEAQRQLDLQNQQKIAAAKAAAAKTATTTTPKLPKVTRAS